MCIRACYCTVWNFESKFSLDFPKWKENVKFILISLYDQRGPIHTSAAVRKLILRIGVKFVKSRWPRWPDCRLWNWISTFNSVPLSRNEYFSNKPGFPHIFLVFFPGKCECVDAQTVNLLTVRHEWIAVAANQRGKDLSLGSSLLSVTQFAWQLRKIYVMNRSWKMKWKLQWIWACQILWHRAMRLQMVRAI